MKTFRNPTFIPALLIVVVWYFSVLAQVIPKKCCCTKGLCSYEHCEKHQKDLNTGPVQNKNNEPICCCTSFDTTSHNFYVTGSLESSKKPLLSPLKNNTKDLVVFTKTTDCHVFAGGSHLSEKPLFLLKNSFLF